MPVQKTRIVKLEWEHWNRKAEEPAHYPKSGEPEDYILGRRHDPKLAEAIGDLWEVILTVGLTTRRRKAIVEHLRELQVVLSSWTGADLCRAIDVAHVYASQRAQEWLLHEVGDYVAFEDCTVID